MPEQDTNKDDTRIRTEDLGETDHENEPGEGEEPTLVRLVQEEEPEPTPEELADEGIFSEAIEAAGFGEIGRASGDAKHRRVVASFNPKSTRLQPAEFWEIKTPRNTRF